MMLKFPSHHRSGLFFGYFFNTLWFIRDSAPSHILPTCNFWKIDNQSLPWYVPAGLLIPVVRCIRRALGNGAVLHKNPENRNLVRSMNWVLIRATLIWLSNWRDCAIANALLKHTNLHLHTFGVYGKSLSQPEFENLHRSGDDGGSL